MIYEPDYRGHRLNYVRLLIEGLAADNLRPTVILHLDAETSPEFEAHLPHLKNVAEIQFVSTVNLHAGMCRREWQKACELYRLIRKLKPHHVYITSGDGIGQMLGLRSFFRNPQTSLEVVTLAGRSINIDAPPKSLLNLKYRLFAFMFTRIKWRAVHLISPASFKWFQYYCPRLSPKVKIIADPTPKVMPIPKREAKNMLALDPDTKCIGCLGLLNKRKGVDLLLAAFFHNLNGNVYKHKLVLAGPLHKELAWIKDKYAAQIEEGGLVIRDGYVDDKEFDGALNALDVLCLPYRNTRWASSGLLLHAAAANLPVLTCNCGWIGKLTTEFGLGETVDINNSEQFYKAIIKSLDKSEQYRLSKKAKQWLECNQEKNFQAAMLDNLRNEKGIASSLPSCNFQEIYQL